MSITLAMVLSDALMCPKTTQRVKQYDSKDNIGLDMLFINATRGSNKDAVVFFEPSQTSIESGISVVGIRSASAGFNGIVTTPNKCDSDTTYPKVKRPTYKGNAKSFNTMLIKALNSNEVLSTDQPYAIKENLTQAKICSQLTSSTNVHVAITNLGQLLLMTPTHNYTIHKGELTSYIV